MNKAKEMELTILACLLIKPSEMEKVIIDDKYFVYYKKMWIFMKSFYKKFKTFDIRLMGQVVENKYKLLDYVQELLFLNPEPAPSLCIEYQKNLIEFYEREKKEKQIIEKIYSLSNELYLKNIDLKKFKEESEKILKEY